MFTKAEILNSLLRLIRSMSIIKSIPFDCCPSGRTFAPIDDRRIYFCYVYPVNTLFFVLFQILRYAQHPHASFDERVVNAFMLFGFTLGIIFQLHGLLHRHQLARLIKRFQTFVMTHRIQHYPSKFNLEFLTTLSIVLLYVNCACTVCIYLGLPNSTRYYYSYFKEKYDYRLMYALFGIHELLTEVSIWQSFFFQIMILFIYSYVTTLELKLLSKNSDPGYSETSKASKIFHYRCLQLLNKEFNAYYRPVIIPADFILQLPMIPIANFMTIRMYDKLSVPILIFLMAYSFGINTGVMLVIGVTASVFESSSGFRRFLTNSLANHNKTASAATYKSVKKWVRVHAGSCFPLKIAIGPFTFFKKATAVATFGFIVYSTMRMVVIF